MMKKTIILALMLSLLSSYAHAVDSTLFSRANVSSQDLDSAALSFTTSFLESDPGFLSYVGVSFAGGTLAPESVETVVVYATSRMGSAFDTELVRTTTVAATTRTITFLFNGAIPVTGLDQIKVTCTNASQSASEVNDDPTVSVTVVIDNAERGGNNVQIFRDGAFILASGIHDYRMHTGDVIPDANQNFGAFYSDFSQIAAPTDPGAGVRRLYADSSTGKLSVRTSSSTSVSLEEQGHTVADEGTPLTQRSRLNFTGGGITCADDAGTPETDCDVPVNPTAGHVIQEEGAGLTQRANLNFIGTGMTCVDNAGTDATDCTATSGGDLTTVGACVTGDCAIEGGNDMFPYIYEGTANTFETTWSVTDPTADNTVVWPNLGGTIALQSAAGFTAGSIPFYASSQLAQDNASLFFDDTNNRLGVGTATPQVQLDITRSSNQARFGTGNTWLQVSSQDAAVTGAQIDFDAIPADATSQATWRVFRNTNTTGTVNITVFNGDGTASAQHLLSSNSDTYFARNTGAVGIGTLAFSSDSKLEVNGHLNFEGTDPTVSACGTTPTIVGSDNAGRVTTGTGVITSCTLTFATAWAFAPACIVNDESAIQLIRGVATTTTLVIDSAAAITSDVISYICIGRG